MSLYQKSFTVLQRYVPLHKLFRIGFNWSPMYRRSTGRVVRVSPDLMVVEVAIPLSWRNANYVGSIFGGSMLSATDPIMMIQLIQILGDDFVVWDKAVHMRFRRPAREKVYALFEFTPDEIAKIRQTATAQGETDWEKQVELRNRAGDVFAVATKTLYIATKAHYKSKRK